eukprot:CAMPEP_0119112868 /NCGR_PEP_ID=MMETSP1180-20130426/42051_1 /TAXON_ID=3052 ORGANISM="Chlamydomonas cf sp, Strain CCMP681" /NCGR_SAMPLE_ID=MMETSP1180 /ASSEMBLY_ACC=CAM_ASM_000741 /LENGTH=32 /DNA_ID= /DNA_START= /DNA_END= /DNA_ORIENTATION=
MAFCLGSEYTAMCSTTSTETNSTDAERLKYDV